MRPGKHIDIDGVRVYYEVHGNGPALVMLHGGLSTVESFDQQVSAFQDRYTVILPERRGHGRTPDQAGDFTYAAMTAETIRFFEALELRQVNLFGWSDGAIVALSLAVLRPELVRSLVLLGGNVRVAGYTESFLEELRGMTAETCPSDYKDPYVATSPDGAEHFPMVFEKTKRLWLSDPVPSPDILRYIQAPALVLIGDRDVIRVEHAAEMYRLIPNAELCVLPGTSHMGPVENAATLNRVLQEFLDRHAPRGM